MTTNNAQHLSTTAQWYTPPELLHKVRKVLGSIDLDPCSTAEANKYVKAAAFFTHYDDGLDYYWPGNVYVNPPSGCDGLSCGGQRCTCKLPFRFMDHMFDQFYEGHTDNAIYLGFNIAQLKYLSKCHYDAADIRFVIPHRRIRFVRPDGEVGKSPTQDNFIMLLTKDMRVRTAFDEEFSDYGTMFGVLS